MNKPSSSLFFCFCLLLLGLSLSDLQGKGAKPHNNTEDVRILDRMLLSIQERSFYTQRQCELYLAVAAALFPDANVPTVQEWEKARTHFRDDKLIWEEVQNTPFYRVTVLSIETNWKKLALAKATGPLAKTLHQLQVQDTELRHVLEEVLIIQNAKSIKSKLSTVTEWVSTLDKKFHSRFFDNTSTYIPVEPLSEKASIP